MRTLLKELDRLITDAGGLANVKLSDLPHYPGHDSIPKFITTIGNMSGPKKDLILKGYLTNHPLFNRVCVLIHDVALGYDRVSERLTVAKVVTSDVLRASNGQAITSTFTWKTIKEPPSESDFGACGMLWVAHEAEKPTLFGRLSWLSFSRNTEVMWCASHLIDPI